MDRIIESVDVVESDVIHTFVVGKEFGGQVVDDIIERNGVISLFNRHDQLIAEIKHLPIFGMKCKDLHAGVDYFGNDILLGDNFVKDNSNGELILKADLERYLQEVHQFEFITA